MLWFLVYVIAYVTIRLFIVVWLRLLARKYINEHRVVYDQRLYKHLWYDYGLCAMVKTAGDGEWLLNAHV